MAKYIIEFEDEPSFCRDGRNYYRCVRAPWCSISDGVIGKLTPYKGNGSDKDEIKVGDVCKYKNGGKTFVITRVYYEGKYGFFDAVYSDGSLQEDGTLYLIEKTGKHIPQIADVLKEIESWEVKK